LLLEQLLSLTNNNTNGIALMKYYLQTRKFNEIIDYQLILSVVKYVCQRRAGRLKIDCRIVEDLDIFKGHILVFLPGPDEISIMKDLCSNLTE
jgi:hypothetical protein